MTPFQRILDVIKWIRAVIVSRGRSALTDDSTGEATAEMSAGKGPDTPEGKDGIGHRREGRVGKPNHKVWFRIVGSSTTGTPVLVVHGGPGLPHDYLETLEVLADARPVIFYDQLGCGKSDRPDDPNTQTLDYFVEELAMVRNELGIDRVHVLGHSWGATLATQYALAKPSGVVSLVLASPLLSVPRWIEDMQAYRRELPARIQETLATHEAAQTTESEEYQAAIAAFYRYCVCRLHPWPLALQRAGQGMGLEVYQSLWGPNEFTCTGSLKDYDCTDRLHEIDVPALFTCGRFDGARPTTTAWYQGLVPRSQLVVFEQSAHMAHLEESGHYAQVVRAFFAQVEQQSGWHTD